MKNSIISPEEKLSSHLEERSAQTVQAALSVYRFYLESAKVNEKVKMTNILWLIGFDRACYRNECEEIRKGAKTNNGDLELLGILIDQLNKFKEDAEPSIREVVQKGEDSFLGFLRIKEMYGEYQKFDDFRNERLNFPFVCNLQQVLRNNLQRNDGNGLISKYLDKSNLDSIIEGFSETSS